MSNIMVHYFSTQNRISPFVALIGEWPDRAAMVKSCRAGTKIGCRPATREEIDLYNESTRSVALTWQSVRGMLWTHRHDALEGYYPSLVKALRKHWRSIKENLAVIQGKQAAKNREREKSAAIVAENQFRWEQVRGKRPALFQAA